MREDETGDSNEVTEERERIDPAEAFDEAEYQLLRRLKHSNNLSTGSDFIMILDALKKNNDMRTFYKKNIR